MGAARQSAKEGWNEGARKPLTYITGTIFYNITYLIGIAFFLFIILIPISIIWQDKPVLSYVYNEVADPLVNSGIGNFFKKGISYLQVPFSEKKQAEMLESYSWKSTIDENSRNKNLGIKITSFKPLLKTIDLSLFENVEAIAEGYALTTDPTQVIFSCSTEKGQGEVLNQNNILSIPPNRKEFFGIICSYDKDKFEIDKNKQTEFQKINVKVSYESLTESYIPIYIIKKEVLDYKTEQGNKGPVRFEYNIFEDEGIEDRNLNKQDRTTSSVYTNGPIKLILRSIYTQPYTEEGPFGSGNEYNIDIKIEDNIQWTGLLNEIKDIEILIPDEIEINSENFEYSYTKDNFKGYTATSDLIEKINNACRNKKSSKLKRFIDEECWRREGITSSVKFSISNPPDEVSQTFIRARVRYSFSDEKQETITFINNA